MGLAVLIGSIVKRFQPDSSSKAPLVSPDKEPILLMVHMKLLGKVAGAVSLFMLEYHNISGLLVLDYYVTAVCNHLQSLSLLELKDPDVYMFYLTPMSKFIPIVLS